MPKSKKRNKHHSTPYIHQERRYKRNLEEVIPLIYAAIAISLHRRYGFGFHRISTVIADSQKLFTESRNLRMEEVMQRCYEETGIDIMSETTAKECGIKGGLEI